MNDRFRICFVWRATSGVRRSSGSICRRLAGAFVTLLLASAIAFNMSMLPYVMWFKIAMPGAFFVACLLGIRYGRRASLQTAA